MAKNRTARRKAEQVAPTPPTARFKLDFKNPQPIPVTDVDVAFPAHALELMPPLENIPEAFRPVSEGETDLSSTAGRWRHFQRVWFFDGLKGVLLQPREGVDPALALRHLQCVQGSFAPKHEHKTAAVAYLGSLWFKDVRFPDESKDATG